MAIVFFAGAIFNSALALPSNVKVRIFQNHAISSLIVDGPFQIEQSPVGRLNHGEISLGAHGLQLSGAANSGFSAGSRLVIRPLTAAPLAITTGGSQRHYRGKLIVTASSGAITLVSEVDSRSYITSVVGSESLPDFPLEALKAQAVLATNVLARYNPGKVLGDSTETQAYLGSDYERPLVKQAVAAVFGQTLLNTTGSTAAVYYHSTCAGRTSDAREIFSGKSVENPAGVACTFCMQSPFYKTLVNDVPSIDLIKHCGVLPRRIVSRDKAGRPLCVEVDRYPRVRSSGRNSDNISPAQDRDSDNEVNHSHAAVRYSAYEVNHSHSAVRDSANEVNHSHSAVRDSARKSDTFSTRANDAQRVEISGYDFWLKIGQGLGWGVIPGMDYDFSQLKSNVRLTSRGAGHGAGFCQWGAAGQARAGKSYKEILKYYFPQTKLSGR